MNMRDLITIMIVLLAVFLFMAMVIGLWGIWMYYDFKTGHNTIGSYHWLTGPN